MFTVVIATHNRRRELTEALLSVFSQEELPRQIVVVDDGSRNKIDAKIFDLCPEGINCILLRNETPMGASFSRNKGVEYATEEYIAFLDDDDLFLPKKLKVVKSFILECKADIYFHPYIANFSAQSLKYIVKPYSGIESFSLAELLKCNFVGGTPMIVISKSAFLRAGGFDTLFPAIEDYELWLRLMKYEAKFVYIPEPLTLCNFTISSNSLSKSEEKDIVATSLLEKKYAEDLANLSQEDYEKYQNNKTLRRIYQAQMSGSNFLAFKLTLRLASKTRSILLVCKSFSYLLGLRFYILISRFFRFLRNNDDKY